MPDEPISHFCFLPWVSDVWNFAIDVYGLSVITLVAPPEELWKQIMVLPLASSERKRLAADEADWNLVGGTGLLTRTRGGGSVRPKLGCEINVSSSDSSVGDISEEEDVTEDTIETVLEPQSEEVIAKKKPSNARVILEVSHLEEVFKDSTCPECNGKLELKLRTVCIASCIELNCLNKDCPCICNYSKPSTTKIHDNERYQYEKMTTYALNVLYVLGFMSVGDGHTEAGRMLGLLGLPNDTTMMNRSFGIIIKSRLFPFIQEICDDIICRELGRRSKTFND
jgi:hypothetical protein